MRQKLPIIFDIIGIAAEIDALKARVKALEAAKIEAMK